VPTAQTAHDVPERISSIPLEYSLMNTICITGSGAFFLLHLAFIPQPSSPAGHFSGHARRFF
jgi:hypothetical protein